VFGRQAAGVVDDLFSMECNDADSACYGEASSL
jgi:hypothetical protein